MMAQMMKSLQLNLVLLMMIKDHFVRENILCFIFNLITELSRYFLFQIFVKETPIFYFILSLSLKIFENREYSREGN